MKRTLQKNKYGQKIWIDEESDIGQSIIQKGIYDENAIHYLEAILSQLSHPICLDIGAHVGNHALVMARYSERVYCFEPQDESFYLLEKNKSENQLHHMEIFNFGLSDQNATLKFYHHPLSGQWSFIAPTTHIFDTELLPCRIGDEILENLSIKKVDFIKIDIEGFEAWALRGLRNTIHKFRPFVMMEWNNDVTKSEFKKHQLFSTLFNHYHAYAVLYNHHKHYWGSHWFGKISRFFYRKLVKRKGVLHQIDLDKSYRNILLCPFEKKWIVEKLK